MPNDWNASAQEYSALASSQEQDAYEYEVNFPSIVSLCPKDAKSVLDIGCGSGEFTAKLSERSPKIEGCDGAENMLVIARQKNPDRVFFCWNLEERFPHDEAEQYDLLVAKLVFMFVKDLERVAGECARILAPRGSLVVSVIHPLLLFFYNPPVADNGTSQSLPEGYFVMQRVKRAVKGNPKLMFEFIHRTVSEYVNAFTGQEFVLEHIDEPAMPEDFLTRHPEWRERRFVPQRLNMKFVKVNRRLPVCMIKV